MFDVHFLEKFQIKLSVFARLSVIFSPLAQEKMEATHVLLSPFNFFDWKEEMVIQLRSKGLYRVTMGTKVEPNSAIEKAKYFNRLDEAYGFLFLSI